VTGKCFERRKGIGIKEKARKKDRRKGIGIEEKDGKRALIKRRK
jgi:hypothetical protein